MIGTADWLTQQNRQLSIGTSRTEQVRSTVTRALHVTNFYVMHMLLTRMAVKLNPLSASSIPARGIDILVSDISGYHFGVPVIATVYNMMPCSLL